MRDQDAIDQRIAGLAARQHGVVAHRQLLELRLTRAAIHRRVAAGRLHPLHRGVYAVGHTVLARPGRWMAAVLACGDRAVLSHVDAGAAWAIRPSHAAPIHVTVPGHGGRRRRQGIRIHRSVLCGVDVTTVDGIPVTTPARTLLDLAEVLPRRALERALDEAEVQRVVDWAHVHHVLARYPRRVGAARLRAALGEHVVGETLTRSALEDALLELCRAHALPQPAVNALVEGHEVDLCWRQERVVVEADGQRFHDTEAAFERDRARDADLVAAGWRVVRVTQRRLTQHPREVARTLRALLAH